MSDNWIAIDRSNFAHEREALEFVRQQFPAHEPYKAWSNFEFIAADGSINEVDLLVFSPQGFFLVEIKSWPGRVSGDAGTWVADFPDGRRRTYDNPLKLTNLKAKRLKSLLNQQRAFRGKKGVPFMEPLVFLSAERLTIDLPLAARTKLCVRDTQTRPGIMAAITRRECEGLRPLNGAYGNPYNRPISNLVGQAMEQAGVRPSKQSRRVGDCLLEKIIDQGPGYQDWAATHAQLAQTKRRVRFYLVRQEASAEDKAMIERAARREYQLLESLNHPNIVRVFGLNEHELGQALTLERHPEALRLDHYLTQRKEPLSVGMQLDLMRQIAEAIAFAHQQRVIHRGLNPSSILVSERRAGYPKVQIADWQLGYRAGSVLSGAGYEVTATAHIDRLLEDSNTAYLAPEALNDADFIGEHLDIFSLGAIAFYLFSGQLPAANGLELSQKLRETNGLQISSVLNGASDSLQHLILDSTNPTVDYRTETVADFLLGLDGVEEALTQPENDLVENPNDAQQGDVLPGNFPVLRRLGQGACSIGFLVEQDDKDLVLKVANDSEHNSRIRDEAEVLSGLNHTHVVEYEGTVEIGNRLGILMKPVLVDREKYLIETLGQRIRKEGPLQIDMLQRFGADLLGAVVYLDDQGVNHRDIKPDNITIGQVGQGSKLHLVLFDFSLSRASRDNIKAGTTGYLDPLLSLRKPAQWDSYAERYAVGITLYEMTTGTLPVWGDGVSDPSYIEDEITLEPERFDAALREPLTKFFEQAFKRKIQARFDNAEEMLRAWRRCFDGIEAPGALLTNEDNESLEKLLAGATLATPILALGLGARSTNALDSINILTAGDLVRTSRYRLQRLKGVGHKTRREILAVSRELRSQLGNPSNTDLGDRLIDDLAAQRASGTLSVDGLAQQISKPSSQDGEGAEDMLTALLGLDVSLEKRWPSEMEVGSHLRFSRGRVAQLLGKLQKRWAKLPAVTQLRNDAVEILQQAGGVMTAREMAQALLLARGCLTDEPGLRMRQAIALVRAAVEVECTRVSPRFVVQVVGDSRSGRQGQRTLIGVDEDWASYGRRLGERADELAQEDPLAAPERAVQELQAIAHPILEIGEIAAEAVVLPERRLLQLAAAAAQGAALSSRQELYPVNMEAERALRLSQGALYGVPFLTVAQVQDRISGRYPAAAALPSRPELDKLLRQFVPTLAWSRDRNGYVNRLSEQAVFSSSTDWSRLPTGAVSVQREISPEQADALLLEDRLKRSIQEGAFLALLVSPGRYQKARVEICDRFDVQLVDYEALFLRCLRQVSEQAKVDWELVLKTDATPNSGDWDKLMLLVRRAMPLVEAELMGASKTVLLIYPGLLARYGQMTLLERLREQVGRADGLPGLWLLVPGRQAMIEGQAVPLLSPGQRARVTDEWLENRHRGRRRRAVAQSESELS